MTTKDFSFSYRISPTSISLLIHNENGFNPIIIPSTHMNFKAVRDELAKDPDYDLNRLYELTDIPRAIAIKTDGRVEVYNGVVKFDGEIIHNYAATRIIEHVQQKLPIIPMMRFLDRLMDNPNKEIRVDLFEWLEKGDMPITEDGCFIGYKYVQDDYYSAHTGKDGKVLHALHTEVSMPREECDENRAESCSTGLHFCGFGYLSSCYVYNNRIIIVKVDPKDVTAIPAYYDSQKGRCCRYQVVGEITDNIKDHYRGKRIVDNDASLEGVKTQPDIVEEIDNKSDGNLDRDAIKEALRDIKFNHVKSGKTFKGYRIWDTVNKKGQRGASAELGVPRTTIQNWLNVINESL